MRFGFTEKMLSRANDIFNSSLGITLSARTLRRYQREAEMVPHTEMLIALTLFHMTRFSDVFRLLGLWRDDSDRFSLDTWIKAEHLRDVQLSPRGAERPEPYSRWESIVDNWGEWPALLSMAFPRMSKLQNRLLHVDQIELFPGLTPVIRPGAIALLEETEGFSNIQAGRALFEWERPIYAIRYKERIFCGYLDSDGEHIALIPHPRSNARRVAFLRHQVEMVGKWIAVASLLPGASGSLSPMPHPLKGA